MLTPKQQRFVDEYLIDLNASAAALRAGYKSGDSGRQLLTKTHVQEAIAAGQDKLRKRSDSDADRVIEELKALAFSDIGQILDFTGTNFKMRPANEIPEAARRAISTVKIRREIVEEGDAPTELIEFRLWPKDPAIEKLMRHLGLFDKDKLKVELEAQVGVNDLSDIELDERIKLLEARLSRVPGSGLGTSRTDGSV